MGDHCDFQSKRRGHHQEGYSKVPGDVKEQICLPMDPLSSTEVQKHPVQRPWGSRMPVVCQMANTENEKNKGVGQEESNSNSVCGRSQTPEMERK